MSPLLVSAEATGCQVFEGKECAELRWERMELRSGEVAEIAYALSNPTVLYASFEVNAHSFYKSTDSGKSWQYLTGPGDHAKDVAVSPTDPDHAYVALSESVWTNDLSIQPTSRSRFEQNERRGDAVTQSILSSNRPPGGSASSFSSIEVAPSDENVLYVAFKGGEGGFVQNNTPVIYKSADRGATWTKTVPDLEKISALAIDPTNPQILYAGSRGGVYRSTDGGQTFGRIGSDSGDVISIEIAPGSSVDGSQTIVTASDYQVSLSIDGGQSWDTITGELQGVHRVRFGGQSATILWASTDDGVYRSTDQGKSWLDVTGNLRGRTIQIVTPHPTDPNVALIGQSSLWSSVRGEGRYRTGLFADQGIFRTEDGGKTWARSDDGVYEYSVLETATHPDNPAIAWSAMNASRGGYRTDDAGQHWRLSQTPTLHYPMRFAFSRQDPDRVYATGWQNGGPFSWSENGGVTWTFVNEGTFFDSVTRGQDLLNRTGERGGEAIHLHGLAVDPTNHDIIYVGSVHDSMNPIGFPLKGAHIFKSVDGGRTWGESDEGFPHEQEMAIHDIKIDPSNPSTLYVGTTRSEANVGRGIFKSTDAGATWVSTSDGLTNDGLDVETIAIHPTHSNELLAATLGGVYRSDDGGSNWARITESQAWDIEYVRDDPEIVYTAAVDGVIKSRDFGQTWYDVSLGLPTDLRQFGKTPFGFMEKEIQSIGVNKTGDAIYAGIRGDASYVARRTTYPPADLPTELSDQSLFGYGRGGPGGGPGGPPPQFPEGFRYLAESPGFRALFLPVAIGGSLVLAIGIGLVIWLIRRRRGSSMT